MEEGDVVFRRVYVIEGSPLKQGHVTCSRVSSGLGNFSVSRPEGAVVRLTFDNLHHNTTRTPQPLTLRGEKSRTGQEAGKGIAIVPSLPGTPEKDHSQDVADGRDERRRLGDEGKRRWREEDQVKKTTEYARVT